jgi:hypothetical protein
MITTDSCLTAELIPRFGEDGRMACNLDISHIEVVDDVVAGILRRHTPAQRLQMVFAIHETMRRLLCSVLRGRHPDWTEQQVSRELARRMSAGDFS